MKILQVVHAFPPSSNAGAEKYTYALSAALGVQHTVDVLYPTVRGRYQQINSRPDEQQPFTRHEVCVTKAAMNPAQAAWAYLRLEHTYINPQADAAFQQFVQRLQPDVIHFQHLLYLSVGYINIAYALGIPTVLTLHDYWFSCPTINLFHVSHSACTGPEADKCRACWSRSRAETASHLPRSPATAALARSVWQAINPPGEFDQRRQLMRQVLARVQRIIAPSKFLRDWFMAEGISAKQITHLENGYDATGLTVNPRHVTRQKLVFGFMGRMTAIKGVHILIDAFMRIPEGLAELRLYGGYDPADPYIHQQMVKIGARQDIRFMGFARDISAAYSELDVLVFPSLWYENCPLTLAECRIFEIPVIASNLGALPEFVQDGVNGLLFEAGNVDALHGHLMQLIAQPERVQDFAVSDSHYPPSMESHAAAVEAIYVDILRGDQP